MPYIDKEFSTSSYRIYCGYSFTGLSVIDEFLDEDTVFDAFLMIDPSWWWDDYVMERRADATLAGRKFNRVQLFIAASGESYPEKYFIKARDVSSLADIAAADESCRARVEVRALHGRVASLDGAARLVRRPHVFLSRLSAVVARVVQRPRETAGSRYETLSARLGERVSLSEDLLTFFGEQFLQQLQGAGARRSAISRWRPTPTRDRGRPGAAWLRHRWPKATSPARRTPGKNSRRSPRTDRSRCDQAGRMIDQSRERSINDRPGSVMVRCISALYDDDSCFLRTCTSEAMAARFDNILHTVGRTPVVKVAKLAPPGGGAFCEARGVQPPGLRQRQAGAGRDRGRRAER